MKDLPSAVALRAYIDEMELKYYSRLLPYTEAKDFLGYVPIEYNLYKTHNSIKYLGWFVGVGKPKNLKLSKLTGLGTYLTEEERIRYLELRDAYGQELSLFHQISWEPLCYDIRTSAPAGFRSSVSERRGLVSSFMGSYGYATEFINSAFDLEVFGVSYRLWVKYTYKNDTDIYPVFKLAFGRRLSSGNYKRLFSLRSTGLPVEADLRAFSRK